MLPHQILVCPLAVARLSESHSQNTNRQTFNLSRIIAQARGFESMLKWNAIQTKLRRVIVVRLLLQVRVLSIARTSLGGGPAQPQVSPRFLQTIYDPR